MTRAQRALLGGIVSLLVCCPALCNTRVEVHADRLQIDNSTGTAVFEGNVKAMLGDLEIECRHMKVQYTPGGALRSVEATGGVAVKKGSATARAKRARLNRSTGLLVLEGEPVLVQGKNRLAGETIHVHLDTGKVEVIKARGMFVLEGNTP